MIHRLLIRYLKFFILTFCVCCIPVRANLLEAEITYKFSTIKHLYPWITKDFLGKIYLKSTKYEIDPLFVCSIIHYESYHAIYRPTLKEMKYATSQSGAMSFMQVMGFHYPENPKRLYDTELNLDKGIQYLKKCLIASKGNRIEAARMYNAGIANNRQRYTNWDNYVYPVCKLYKEAKQISSFKMKKTWLLEI